MTMFQSTDQVEAGDWLNVLGGDAGDVQAWKLSADGPPLFIAPAPGKLETPQDFMAWIEANLPNLDKLLVQHGGIVFRGFSIRDAREFNAFVALFKPFSGNYRGGAAPRNKIVGQVYETTQIAGPLKLPLHQEMAYVARGPGKIVFYCHKPAEEGGETIIADMRRVTRNLSEELRKKMVEHGIVGIRNFEPPPPDDVEVAQEHPDQRSWKFGFYTEDKAEVEAECHAKGVEPIWRADGGLCVRNLMPAFAAHPATGELIYRNTLHTNGGRDYMQTLTGEPRRRVEEMFARQPIKTGFYLGDGSELTDDEMKALQAVFDEAELAWPWQAGDIMLLDNLLTAHGRNSFKGARDVQVALLD